MYLKTTDAFTVLLCEPTTTSAAFKGEPRPLWLCFPVGIGQSSGHTSTVLSCVKSLKCIELKKFYMYFILAFSCFANLVYEKLFHVPENVI